MNPNDPMENPEALNNKCMRVGENMDDGYSHNGNSLENGRFGALGNDAQRHMRGRGRGSNGGSTTDFVSEQSQFDDSVNQRSPRSNHRRNISKGGSSTKSFSSSSHTTNKSRNTSFNDQPVTFLWWTIPSTLYIITSCFLRLDLFYGGDGIWVAWSRTIEHLQYPNLVLGMSQIPIQERVILLYSTK